MKHVTVECLEPGWQVTCELNAAPLVFMSGSAAERQALRLGAALADAGERVTVVVRDRGGLLVGSRVVG